MNARNAHLDHRSKRETLEDTFKTAQRRKIPVLPVERLEDDEAALESQTSTRNTDAHVMPFAIRALIGCGRVGAVNNKHRDRPLRGLQLQPKLLLNSGQQRRASSFAVVAPTER
jgi:hypothetical protein